MTDHNEARELAERIITDTDANGSGADAPWALPLAAAYLEDHAEVERLREALGRAGQERDLAHEVLAEAANREGRSAKPLLATVRKMARERGEFREERAQFKDERDEALRRAGVAERELDDLNTVLMEIANRQSPNPRFMIETMRKVARERGQAQDEVARLRALLAKAGVIYE